MPSLPPALKLSMMRPRAGQRNSSANTAASASAPVRGAAGWEGLVGVDDADRGSVGGRILLGGGRRLRVGVRLSDDHGGRRRRAQVLAADLAGGELACAMASGAGFLAFAVLTGAAAGASADR